MTKSERIFYYDFLRSVAIIGIVFCHASIPFISTGVNGDMFYISAFFDCFRDFSIPIFVMLSGALLINRKDSAVTFFKRRLSRIFVPFLFWFLLYVIYAYRYIPNSHDLGYMIDVFFGTSSTFGVTFWFVWMIIIVYIGIFIVNRIISYGCDKSENFDAKLITSLTAMSVAYIVMVHFGLFDPYHSKILYFVSFMSYIMIGYYIANTDYIGDLLGNKVMIIVTAFLSAASYCYYIFGFVVPASVAGNHFSYLGYFNLLILFISLNIFLLFKYLDFSGLLNKIKTNKLGLAITSISAYSFGIYLSHYLILAELRRNLIKFVDIAALNPLVWIPALAVSALAIALIVLMVMNKNSYLSKFTGNS